MSVTMRANIFIAVGSAIGSGLLLISVWPLVGEVGAASESEMSEGRDCRLSSVSFDQISKFHRVCRVEFEYEVCFISNTGLSCISKHEDDSPLPETP